MTGQPGLLIKLDDFTGTFPYDITQYARMPEGLSWSRGRQDELSQISPGSMAITLDNSDGRFSQGSATYSVSPDQKVRISELLPATAAACNLQPNPSFETSSGVTQLGTSAVFTFDATQHLYDTQSLKFAPLAGATGSVGAILAESSLGVADGLTYTVSAYLMRTAGVGTFDIGIEWRDAAHATIGSTVNAVVSPSLVNGQWVRVSMTATAPALTRFARLRLFYAGSYTTGVDVVFADGVMLNLGSTAPEWNALATQQTFTRFTGNVQSWPVDWPGGGDTFATVKLTGVDTLARFSRKKLRSAAQEEILRTIGTGGYYPFSEAAGATQAADFSGNDGPAFLASNAVPVWGVPLGVTDGSTGAQVTLTVSTNYLGYSLTNGTWTSPTLSFDIVLNGNTSGSNILTLVSMSLTSSPLDGGNLTLDPSTNTLAFTGKGTGAACVLSHAGPPLDGKGHVISVQVDSAGAAMWIDGVVVTAIATGITGTWTSKYMGLGTVIGTGIAQFTIGQFNFTSRQADADVLRHHNAILSDLNGETPQARIARVCSYIGQTTGSLDTTGSTLMGPASQSGKSVQDVFNEVTDATLGFVYADSSGNVSSVNGMTLVARTTPDLTIDANYLGEDLAVPFDMFGVTNYVTGKADFSANVTIVQNAISRGIHGDYPADLSWNVSTDAQAADRARWFINNYGGPDSRYPTLTIDLLSLDTSTVAAAMTLDLGRFVHLTGMPSQNPRGGGVVDLIVQGITEKVSASEWSLTLNCSRHSLVEAWILDDPFHSVLDATTKLYI